jgi:hypothetical protein
MLAGQGVRKETVVEKGHYFPLSSIGDHSLKDYSEN